MPFIRSVYDYALFIAEIFFLRASPREAHPTHTHCYDGGGMGDTLFFYKTSHGRDDILPLPLSSFFPTSSSLYDGGGGHGLSIPILTIIGIVADTA